MASPSAEVVRTARVRVVKNVLVLMALAGITYFFAEGFEKRAKGTDFPEFYAAARMVREGYGHDLFNIAKQDQFQIRYAGRIGTYYNHPPFEALLYLPFSLWSLPTAYLLWCLFNAALLACIAIIFQRHIFSRWDWRVVLLLFLLFPPVLLNFLQGQDSLLLLLFMTLAAAELKRNRNFAAGCWLGCGLFKFHLILSVVLLVATLGKKGFLRGFAIVLVGLLLVSAGISGWGFLMEYPRFLVRIGDLPLAGIHPAQMANLRGIIGTSAIAHGATAQLALTLIVSAALFWYAGSSARKMATKFPGAADLAISTFLLAGILFSYNLSPHDLCVTLLPLGMFSQYLATQTGVRQWARIGFLCCLDVFFLPPLHVLLLAWHVYAYVGILILIMFLGARWLQPAQLARSVV
jgi:hypothetical protein